MSQTVDAQILRDTLLTIEDVTNLVTENGEVKVFWESVDEDEAFPYIVTNYLYGGYDTMSYSSQATQRVWKVTGITGNRLTALALADAIHKLHLTWPVADNVEGACGYSHIVEINPFFETHRVQNVKVFEVGGYYHLPVSYERVT